MITKKQLALIHIAKNQLGLSDPEYRALLAEFGVKSSKDLTNPQFDRVMKKFQADGFVPINNATRTTPRTTPERAKAPMMRKIGAILNELNLTWAYADGIARRMFGVDKVDWVHPDQLHAVVTALVKKQQRERSNISKQQARTGRGPTCR